MTTTQPIQSVASPQNSQGSVSSPSQQLQQKLTSSTPISGKTIALGCGIFFVIFALIVVMALTAALQNPSSLESVGILPETVKTVVKGIILFIALLFFFSGFALSVWSGYRLFTKKEGNKIGYVGGLGLGILAVIGAIAGGTIGIMRVNAMDVDGIVTNSVINPYLVVKQTNDRRVKNGKVYLGEPGLKVIAPAQVSFQFNQDNFNRAVAPSLGGTLQSIVLDCGNGQIIDSSSIRFTSDLFFGRACLYLNKGSYTQSLTYRYIDKTTNQQKEFVADAVFKVDVHSEISLTTKQGGYQLNDAKSEIILGENPVQVFVDATSIASDLGLVDPTMSWDMDGDGKEDKKRVNFSHYYYEPKLHMITYALPSAPGIIYQIPVRVNQSNVPSCTVTTKLVKDNQYVLGVQLADAGVGIDSYQFEIVDQSTDEVVDQKQSTKSSLVYDFAPGRQYQVRAFFTTDDNKQGVCETDDLAINNSSYLIKSSFSVKYPNATSFTPMSESGSNIFTITTVPAQVQIKVDEIVPPITRPVIKVMANGQLINPSSQQTYLLKIDSKKDYTISISVTDDKGKTTTQQYKIVSDVSPIVGVIKASTKVGFDPLTVTLDASISQLNDPEDEVVYFTWDFGDGTIVRNVSQGSIKHVYRFSESNESGSYRPKVTVTTQKGFTDTIELSEDIVVKRAIRDVKITSPTHPAQLVRVGDQVNFVLQTDGPVKSVNWDFGNGQTTAEEGRQGTDVRVNYDQKGMYDVIAVVEFSDHPPVTQTLRIRVE